MTKKVILVVDDDPDIQDLINKYLSELGIEIHPAFTGEEGIKKYKELMEGDKKPDIVVMDLNLTEFGKGKIDGVETTRRIIQMDPHAIIYVFTAYFNTKWSKGLEETGVKGLIARPVGFSSFKEIMKKILAGEKVEIPEV